MITKEIGNPHHPALKEREFFEMRHEKSNDQSGNKLIRVFKIYAPSEIRNLIAAVIFSSLFTFFSITSTSILDAVQNGRIPQEIEVVVPTWIAAIIIFAGALSIITIFVIFRQRKTTMITKFDRDLFSKSCSSAREIIILNTYIPNFEDIKTDLIEALNKGVSVRILMLRPDCKEADFRAQTLGKSVVELRQDIKRSCDFLYTEIYSSALKNNRNLRLSLRFHSAWIPFSMYSTESYAIIGFFFLKRLAVDGPSIILKDHNEKFKVFLSQFENLWDSGVEIINIANWADELRCKQNGPSNALAQTGASHDD
jgi:hypothetical protein